MNNPQLVNVIQTLTCTITFCPCKLWIPDLLANSTGFPSRVVKFKLVVLSIRKPAPNDAVATRPAGLVVVFWVPTITLGCTTFCPSAVIILALTMCWWVMFWPALVTVCWVLAVGIVLLKSKNYSCSLEIEEENHLETWALEGVTVVADEVACEATTSLGCVVKATRLFWDPTAKCAIVFALVVLVKWMTFCCPALALWTLRVVPVHN